MVSHIEEIPKDTANEKVTITLPENSFTYHRLKDKPSLQVDINPQELLNMYSEMSIVRELELVSADLYNAEKKIRGFCHTCIGQEAIPVAMEFALTKFDNVITSYRSHAFTYMRGGSLQGILAENMGRSTGISKGKGGSMHMFLPSFFGGHGIVGAQVPLGAGLAFRQKYDSIPAATFALYGDGASNQGQVYEAFNMAALWKLPCVFVCENNQFGMGTAADRASASTEYYTRTNYIPGIKVNGMDPVAVYRACQWAKEHAVSGKGPVILELATYRFVGHSVNDDGSGYRNSEEVEKVRASSDPMVTFANTIIKHGVATKEHLRALESHARTYVAEARQQAEEAPEPSMDEFFTDIYIPGSEPGVVRGRIPSESHHFQ
ncbi:putative PDA1-pyruvate dehydrogenase alpha chain precursor [Fennellomyces sp. T-0311]|nr:putative PDA1-pyruvate dehydrogenase alpha chain precursor [Fennellomyces sp. T-0311]